MCMNVSGRVLRTSVQCKRNHFHKKLKHWATVNFFKKKSHRISLTFQNTFKKHNWIFFLRAWILWKPCIQANGATYKPLLSFWFCCSFLPFHIFTFLQASWCYSRDLGGAVAETRGAGEAALGRCLVLLKVWFLLPLLPMKTSLLLQPGRYLYAFGILNIAIYYLKASSKSLPHQLNGDGVLCANFILGPLLVTVS